MQKFGIDKTQNSSYYAVMKGLIVFICFILILPFCGCYQAIDNSAVTTPPTSSDSLENVPTTPELDTDNSTGITENEDKDTDVDIEAPSTDIPVILTKKSYVVSTVNQLRVRSSPNSSSTTLGYLDKNDAVLLIEKQGNYYKTVYREKTAYVHKSYCKIMEIDSESEDTEKAIDLGCKLLGHPYVWGSQRYHWGNGKLNTNFVPGEFDCSALVQYVYYHSNGVLLDLTTRTQVKNGIEVKRSELKRGDLMFFTNSSRKNLTGNERIGHVGIYFGNNYILHTASDHAVIEPISDLRWSYYITARRVV